MTQDEREFAMRLTPLFRRQDPAANVLYGEIVTQARMPELYRHAGVPDTVQGRFEMIALHMFLVLHRLKQAGSQGTDLAQDLFDTMFQDMDRNLRELGTGDLAVGKRIKTLARNLYGRIAAYEQGLTAIDDAALKLAVERNVLAGMADPARSVAPAALAAYIRRQAGLLAAQPYEDIAAGRVRFASLAPNPS